MCLWKGAVPLHTLYLHPYLLQLLGCFRMQVNAPEGLLLWDVTRLVCSWFVCVRSIYGCSSVEILVIKTWGACIIFLCVSLVACVFTHNTEDKMACRWAMLCDSACSLVFTLFCTVIIISFFCFRQKQGLRKRKSLLYEKVVLFLTLFFSYFKNVGVAAANGASFHVGSTLNPKGPERTNAYLVFKNGG